MRKQEAVCRQRQQHLRPRWQRAAVTTTAATTPGQQEASAEGAKGGTRSSSARATRAPGPPADVHRPRPEQLRPAGLPQPGGLPGVNDPTEGRPRSPTSPPTPARPPRRPEWSFTVKDGVKWEDGKAITCEDFKYGASRNFATDVIIGGPSNYLFTYLDIPTGDDGCRPTRAPTPARARTCSTRPSPATARRSPTTSRSRGRTSRCRSRSCATSTRTARTSTRVTRTTSSSSPTVPTSSTVSGPKAPAARSSATRTGTRRPTRSARRSPTSGSSARVTRTRRSTSRCSPTPVTRQYGVTERRIPPTFYAAIPEAEDRYTHVESPFIDYLLPNFNSPVTNLSVREALALATSKAAWIQAGGGDKAFNAGATRSSTRSPRATSRTRVRGHPRRGRRRGREGKLEESGETQP